MERWTDPHLGEPQCDHDEHAGDDFGRGGNAVEKGEGIRGKGDWWEYVPSAKGKIVVEARDLAGNVTKKELNN